ncbi:MAG: DUF1822 family protein [Coleofasciculus sp. G3-WIS-01]|uniref:DUF1822 family protein n=1 Tax=Coleofasciculus sp. G3-WIS-01 TaxID=3069528 RepID=UPI0032F10254
MITINNKVKLGWQVHQKAKQFRQHQSTPFNFVNAQQVYLNTLAVYAVNDYLKRQGIETDLTESDSWDPLMQSLVNIADLKVKRQGQWVKLECRPVFSDTNFVYIPAEVWEDRIGYVAVGINESLTEATLLGFTPTVTTEELSLSQFQSLNDLLKCLTPKSESLPLVNLSRWFDNIVAEGWQTVEALLGTPDVSLAFRSINPATVKRGKTIQLKDHSLALILDLNQDNEQNIRIRVKVRSLGSNTSLPEGITLRVLDETGEPFLETQAGKADSSIQTKPFQFIEQPEEKFTVKVVLGEESITENFLI